MRPSWASIFVALIGACCGAFALFPKRWSPAPYHGILAGMAMYFVAFSRAAITSWAETGQLPSLFGPRGIAPMVLYRAIAFLVILVAVSYVYFDRRSFFDVTWPVLILASWNLAEGMLRTRAKARA